MSHKKILILILLIPGRNIRTVSDTIINNGVHSLADDKII